MYVGVILCGYQSGFSRGCIPHVCGGDPSVTLITPIQT